MAVYAIEGKLGTGKTKFAVWRAQLALAEGRRVAGNVDLFLDHLCPKDKRARFTRIPDKPTLADLQAMGHGNPESYDEERNGALLLDELATWLNARSFNDPARAGVLDWLVHARKLGWDVYLIVQDVGMIDKQVREALVEYSCRCMRLDRVKLPLVGGLLNDLGGALLGPRGRRWGYLPRLHTVAARVGQGSSAVVAERWHYRGGWLHAAYDTRQVFSAAYPHGPHSVLHPRYFDPPKARSSWLRSLLGIEGGTRQRAPLKPKQPAVAEVMRLPPGDRIAALRTAGVLSG